MRREAIEHARGNIVARIGNVDFPRGGMDGYAIRFHEGGAIGDKIGCEELVGANIYYAVAYFIFVGFITILCTNIIERVAEDGEVADGDVDSAIVVTIKILVRCFFFCVLGAAWRPHLLER